MDLVPERRRYEPGETRALPGAHAVPRGDGAGHGRARGRRRARFVTLSRQRSGASRCRCTRRLRAERLRLGARGARPRRRRAADRARRSRQAGVPARHRRDAGRLARAPARGARRADRADLRVRETARVRSRCATADGAAPPPGSEIALAAVDEGLLELAPNPSWKLLDAMMGRRGYEVRTSTAQIQVVGKRHYGRKAVPRGGGGGRAADARALRHAAALERARRARRAGRGARRGAAERLADELPHRRGRDGRRRPLRHRRATIRTTQDLMVLPGLPPVVREGDRFRAELHAAQHHRAAGRCALAARVEGLAGAARAARRSLAAGESREVEWDVDGAGRRRRARLRDRGRGGPRRGAADTAARRAARRARRARARAPGDARAGASGRPRRGRAAGGRAARARRRRGRAPRRARRRRRGRARRCARTRTRASSSRCARRRAPRRRALARVVDALPALPRRRRAPRSSRRWARAARC